MGLTFKENCADTRNSGSKGVIDELTKTGCDIDIHDPWADKEDVLKIYKKLPISELKDNLYDGVIITVAHDIFRSFGINKISNLCKNKHVIYDLKYLFSSEEVDLRL